LLATLVLSLIGWQMRAAGLSLRPLVFVAVFSGIIALPQLAAHTVNAIWRKPQPQLNEAALVGEGGFAQPALLFGAGVDAARLQDARAVFPEALANAEVAQLLIGDASETAIAARFGDEAQAREAARILWTMFDPRNTSASDANTTTWGTRRASDDRIALQRIGRGLFMWTGPTRERIESRKAHAQVLATPPDARPSWLRRFDRWQMQAIGIAALVLLASAWFLKGAAWAARIEPRADAVSAAELGRRIEALARTNMLVHRLADGRFEVRVQYDTIGEVGSHRYVLELDERQRRVEVLEYIASSVSPSGQYNWKLQLGITFYRKQAGFDLEQTTGPLIRTVTQAGWTWQPLLFDAPPALRWLTS
jgi:hypothetical protein